MTLLGGPPFLVRSETRCLPARILRRLCHRLFSDECERASSGFLCPSPLCTECSFQTYASDECGIIRISGTWSIDTSRDYLSVVSHIYTIVLRKSAAAFELECVHHVQAIHFGRVERYGLATRSKIRRDHFSLEIVGWLVPPLRQHLLTPDCRGSRGSDLRQRQSK